MSKRDLLSVALRVLGVVMFAYTLAEVPSSVSIIHSAVSGTFMGVTNVPLYVLLSILGILFGLGIGLGLALRGDALARLVERDDTKIDLQPAEMAKPGLMLALRVVGVIMVAYAIPHIVRLFASSLLDLHRITGNTGLEDLADAFTSTWYSHWADVVPELVQIAIGVYLAFWCEGLVRLMLRERSAETIEEPDV